MSEKNEQCSWSTHVWPDDGDTCKCGAMTHADLEREAKREWTIIEKLEKMGTDRLLRSILTKEDCEELIRNRTDAMGHARRHQTRTKEMRAQAEKQCADAQNERQALATCPGRGAATGGRSELWERLFMFYLPRCYDVAVEAPTEQARLQARVMAAVRMANDAFALAWENRA